MKLLLLLLSVLLPLAWCDLILYKTPTDVDSAEATCKRIGGHLASVHSPQGNDNIVNYLKQYGNVGDTYWIGLEGYKSSSDNAVQNYTWTDGSSYSWNNFKTSNPKGTGRMCTLFAGGLWLAVPCDGSTNQFLCVIKAQTNPPTPTPTLTTTTVRTTTTTKITNNCPDEYSWYEPANMCYRLHTNQVDFETAKRTCQSQDDVLASIHSQDQQNFLGRHVIENTYIGLYYDIPSSQWKWVDGSPVDYLDWYPGQPDNMKKEFWVEINISAFREQWNNITSDKVKQFFCQRPNPSHR